jgi:hypothetical protein
MTRAWAWAFVVRIGTKRAAIRQSQELRLRLN